MNLLTNDDQEIEIKRELARKHLNRLTPILTTKKLHVCTRLKIYKVAITTILIDASEGWWLTSKARRMIRLFNARSRSPLATDQLGLLVRSNYHILILDYYWIFPSQLKSSRLLEL